MEENWVSLEERGLVVSSEPVMGNGLLVLVAIWVREISFLQSLMQFIEGFYKLVIWISLNLFVIDKIILENLLGFYNRIPKE